MSIESFTAGVRVDTPIDDTPFNVGVDATWKASSGELDAVRVRVGFGDSKAPKGVESTTTQDWTMPDGSARQIELPRISAERREHDDATRTSVGVTITGAEEQLSTSPELTGKPSASLAVGTNGEDTAATLRATLAVQKLEINLTPGTEGVGAANKLTPNANDTNAGTLGSNNEALRGAVIVWP